MKPVMMTGIFLETGTGTGMGARYQVETFTCVPGTNVCGDT